MAFQFGIPKKLIQRVTEIEIDTHYYDKDVVPSAQEIFTFTVDKNAETAVITGLVNTNTVTAVIPYQVQYDQTSQELMANVIELSENCFSDNTALKTITIPNTIHEIPSNCFKNCSALETVNIPTSVHTIKANAFNNCDKLKSVFIPYGVNTIENGAFLECDNLKIICYKHSTAEEYAVAHDIPYSLISYTLDDDITENSENLVTSGVIYSHVKWIKDRIEAVYKELNTRITTVRTELINKINGVQTNLTTHINNKLNPHDNATFKNANLTGNASIEKGTLNALVTTTTQDENGNDVEVVTDNSLINRAYLDERIDSVKNPEEGSAYQTIVDNSLQTDSKTVPGAINELNDRAVNTISGTLIGDTWNTVSLNKLYALSWRFLNKPYCFTDEGINVDYRIKNKSKNDTSNTFDIWVPVDCNYMCSTAAANEISGFPVDYLLVSYYYTGADGKDLDTVTGITNASWPLNNATVGYGHSSKITNANGTTIIQFVGDNTGGGSSNASTKYYETIYFNLKAIQELLPNEDVEVILYGTWYSEMNNGHINVSLQCYTSDSEPTINVNSTTKVISLGNVTESYSTNEMECSIVTKKGGANNYKTSYTPAFKLVFHKTTDESNHRTISIQALS